MKNFLVPLTIICCVLSGCDTGAKRLTALQLSYVPTSITPGMDQAATQATSEALTESAEASTQMLNRLSAIKLATHPLANMRDIPLNARRFHLTRQVSVDWYGPMLPVVKLSL